MKKLFYYFRWNFVSIFFCLLGFMGCVFALSQEAAFLSAQWSEDQKVWMTYGMLVMAAFWFFGSAISDFFRIVRLERERRRSEK